MTKFESPQQRFAMIYKGLSEAVIPHNFTSQMLIGRTELNEALRLAREGMEDDGWISVEERLPEPEVVDGFRAPFVPVIFYHKIEGVCAGRYFPASKPRNAKWWSLQGINFTNRQVTHWQPLPPPPDND